MLKSLILGLTLAVLLVASAIIVPVFADEQCHSAQEWIDLQTNNALPNAVEIEDRLSDPGTVTPFLAAMNALPPPSNVEGDDVVVLRLKVAETGEYYKADFIGVFKAGCWVRSIKISRAGAMELLKVAGRAS